MKTLSVVAFGMIDTWVKSFFPVFWFSNLSIMSASSILNDSEVGGEETIHSLKGSFCLIEEPFCMVIIPMEQSIENDL